MTATARARWIVVSATGVLTGLGHGFGAFAVSALLKPLAVDLDTGRGAVSTAIGLGRLVSGLASPLVGRATDRWGTRWISIVGIIVAAIGLLLLGFVRNEFELYIAWSVVFSIGTAIGFTVTLDKLVVTTLSERRGMALAIRFSIAAVVSTFVVPTVSYMVDTVGWRQTSIVWGFVLLAMVAVPLVWFRDQNIQTTSIRPALTDAVPVQRSVLRDRNFWVIGLALAAQAGVTTGLSVHLVSIMTDHGLAATSAGSLFGLMILLSIPVRILSGYVADKFATRILPIVLGLLLVLEALAIASFAWEPGLLSLITLIGAMGVAAGAPTLLVLVLCSKLFGESKFATIQGSLMLMQVPATMVAPMAAGYLYDYTGNYEMVSWGFAAVLLSGGTLVMLLIRTDQVEAGN